MGRDRDYDIMYPAKYRQNLDGGLNNKYEKYVIQDNESPGCLNVIFDEGSVETRLGSAKFNTAAVGSFAGHGIYTRHDRDNSQSLCVWFNGTLWVASGTSFHTVASAQSIFTAGERVCAAEYENYIYFNNGYNVAYKYADSVFNRQGVYAPISAPAIASNSTGVLSGDYRYKVTYVNSGLVESDVSSANTTFVASANQLRVTVPTAPTSWGIIRRRIYRTVTSGSTFMRLTEISDNSTTTYDDNTADGSLGTTAPTDQGVPPKYSAIITHQNRLFCNDLENPNLVWYSELGNPYVFKTTSFEEIGDNSGDLIKGFEIHDNGLVVLTDGNPYMIYMPSVDPTVWEVVKLRGAYGTRSPFGLFRYANKVMFPAVQNDKFVGYAAISGDAVDPEATLLTVSAVGSDMKSDKIEPDIFLTPSAMVPKISSMVYKNKGYISVAYGLSETANNRIYVFDFSASNLSKDQDFSWAPWSGLNIEQFTVYNGTLYGQSSTANGFVYELEKSGTYNDSGSAINSYFWTKEYSGIPGDEQCHKDFRYFNIMYEKSGNYYMNVNYRVDSDLGDGDVTAINLSPGVALYGSAIFGTDTYGSGVDVGEQRIYLGQIRGKRIQFKFTNRNTVDQKFRVVGLQFSYNRKGRR